MALNPYLVIISFALMLYFPALKCLIIVDDIRWYGMIKEGRNIHWKERPKWGNILPWLSNRLYGGGTFGINWNQKITRWCITSAQIDHAFSVLLTAIIALLMYFDFHSLLACLLWLSASSTTHVAVWLNGRRYALNCIIVLLMVACLNAGGWWRLLAIPLYASTSLFHFTAFFAPILYWPSLPLVAMIGWWNKEKIIRHWDIKEKAVLQCSRKDYSIRRLIPVIKSYGFYFFKMLFPMMTRTNYNTLYMWGLTPEGDKDTYAKNIDFYKGICAGFISILVFYYLPHNMQASWIFATIATLQWCNIVNSTQIVADRYMVLPNIFFQVILAYSLPIYIVLPIIVCNVCFTAMSFRMYENIQGMFDYHLYHWPQYTTPNKEYIALCVKQGNYIKAYTIVKECLKFNPTDWDLLVGAAICAKVANDRPQARKYVETMEGHLYFGMEDRQIQWMADFKRSL